MESGWFVTFHKLKFERPIRPGVWTARLQLQDGHTIMERQFLVVPLTHEKMKTLENPRTINAARVTNSEEFPTSQSPEFLEWKQNVLKTGEGLEEWLDKLVAGFWSIEGVCRTNSEKDGCGYVRDCHTSTEWSTFSPDIKSDIAGLREDADRLR